MNRIALALPLALVTHFADAQVQITESKVKINGVNVAKVSKTNDLQDQIDSLITNVVTPLQSQVASLQSDLQAAQATVSQLTNDLAAAESDIATLESEDSDLHARIDSVDSIEGLPGRAKVVNDKIWMRSDVLVTTDSCFNSLGPSGGTGVAESSCP